MKVMSIMNSKELIIGRKVKDQFTTIICLQMSFQHLLDKVIQTKYPWERHVTVKIEAAMALFSRGIRMLKVHSIQLIIVSMELTE